LVRQPDRQGLAVWFLEATISETITKGRQNQMPAWKEFLGDAKVHLLSAYVLSLSQGE
jgi:cytochrome c oxidase cbb3-type subunit 3